MNSKGKYYMTTAIAYASGKPHIGNTYEIVLADAIARFKRQEGYEVYFQTGTDEHGQKIEQKAQEAGVTPKEYVDQVADGIKKIWDLMGVLMISLSVRRMLIMRSRYRRFLKSCLTRGIFTKALMKGCIVRHVNRSGQSRSLLTVNAQTAVVR